MPELQDSDDVMCSPRHMGGAEGQSDHRLIYHSFIQRADTCETQYFSTELLQVYWRTEEKTQLKFDE